VFRVRSTVCFRRLGPATCRGKARSRCSGQPPLGRPGAHKTTYRLWSICVRSKSITPPFTVTWPV